MARTVKSFLTWCEFSCRVGNDFFVLTAHLWQGEFVGVGPIERQRIIEY